MCGFTGFFTKEGSSKDAIVKQLDRMSATLLHRGPDSSGTWFDCSHGIALSHRRLAIQDLSPSGHQPMESQNGRYVIVFNGEIYNFLDIKRELESKGEIFQGNSDTEVMLSAITVWGIRKSLDKFNGMFAFALWDREAKKLVLARDRAGEKPLYYGWQNNTFLFGSELKALRQHSAWENQIDQDALTLFFRHNFIPAPYSVFKGIKKLLPGSCLVVDFETYSTVNEIYWSCQQVYESGISQPLTESPGEIVEMLESELRKSIQRQMIADVPLGAFLSGGIDSSTIVALMQSVGSSPVKTFTIGFNEAEFNEAKYARSISEQLNTEHTELYLTPEQTLEVVPDLPEIYDEPFADSSQIPTYLVSRLARQSVTVSLSGDAGDELFCGYSRYFSIQKYMDELGAYPEKLVSLTARLIRTVPGPLLDLVIGSMLKIFTNRQHRYAGKKIHLRAETLLKSSLQQLYQHKITYWHDKGLVLNGAEPAYVLNDRAQMLNPGSIMQQMQYLDGMCYLPDDILVKVDRAAMANSLETRVPLLDRNILELAARIPTPVNLLHKDGKWPLRQILSKYVDQSLFERPKQGFAVPVNKWLRGELNEWASDLLNSDRLRQEGILNVDMVRQHWQDHQKGVEDNSFKLWGILMFESWLDRWQ